MPCSSMRKPLRVKNLMALGTLGQIRRFLLARAGVDVLVLGRHADFLRDLRGTAIPFADFGHADPLQCIAFTPGLPDFCPAAGGALSRFSLAHACGNNQPHRGIRTNSRATSANPQRDVGDTR